MATEDNSHTFETVSASGTVYLTLDNHLVLIQRFHQHIKVNIHYDKAVSVVYTHEEGNSVSVTQPCDEKLGTNHMYKLSDVDNDQSIEQCFSIALTEPGVDTQLSGCLKTETLNALSDEGDNSPQLACATKHLSHKTAGKNVIPLESRVTRSFKPKEVDQSLKISDQTDTQLEEPDAVDSGIHLSDMEMESSSSDTEALDNSDKREKKSKLKKLEQEKEVSCEYCKATFKSQQHFFDHRKARRSSFQCKHCSKVVPFKAHLMVHMRKHKKSLREEDRGSSAEDQKNIKCEICGLTMSKIPILKTHMMLHTSENAYKCCVCGEKSHSIAMHKNHMTTHVKAGTVQCKICNISFLSRSELSKHQLTHEFKCNICDKVFLNKTSRTFHYKIAHKDDILKCDVCGKMYSCSKDLEAHLKYHRQRTRTQCTICGIMVIRIDKHMLSHSHREEEGKLYVCDQCPKQFKQKLSFQRHLLTHSEEKPYACMECPKRFARSGGLNRHMVIHTQEKPFVCQICGKACSQMGNLRIHMQVHKDCTRGSVQCQECGESFLYKAALQEHMKASHYMDPMETARYLDFQSADVYYVQ